MSITDVNELAIWWLSQKDCEAIDCGEEGTPPEILPEYLKEQYRSRWGRAGRGRLWVPKGIEIQDIEWPEDCHPLATIAADCGGIVFWRKDIDALSILPGLVTDLFMNRL